MHPLSWIVGTLVHPHPNGALEACVLIKCGYAIAGERLVGLSRPIPFEDADRFAGNDFAAGEVLAETDLHARKPCTDVVVSGHAWVPRRRTAFHIDSGATVGDLEVSLRVWGDRCAVVGPFGTVRAGDPHPFSSMPLGYRRAFGGTSRTRSGERCAYPRNPIGIGFTLRGAVHTGDRIPMPNIEPATHPIRARDLVLAHPHAWPRAPRPLSLGWTRRDFYPRYTYAGARPDHADTARRRASSMSDQTGHHLSVPPMDPRFCQGASAGLWGGPLRGDEAVTLRHLDPALATQTFALPGKRPHLRIRRCSESLEPPPSLHTVVIDKNANTLALVWGTTISLECIEQFATLSVAVESESCRERIAPTPLASGSGGA